MAEQWIKTTERLPEPCCEVWIWIRPGDYGGPEGNVQLAWYDPPISAIDVIPARWNSDNDGCVPLQEVTHWMDLRQPDPPEED